MTGLGNTPRLGLDYTGALAEAEVWAEAGYTAESRAYWAGMRDTLRVVLGVTASAPTLSTADAAATVMFRVRR